MGQKAGEKWTAEAVSQPTIPKSDRLLDAGLVLPQQCGGQCPVPLLFLKVGSVLQKHVQRRRLVGRCVHEHFKDRIDGSAILVDFGARSSWCCFQTTTSQQASQRFVRGASQPSQDEHLAPLVDHKILREVSRQVGLPGFCKKPAGRVVQQHRGRVGFQQLTHPLADLRVPATDTTHEHRRDTAGFAGHVDRLLFFVNLIDPPGAAGEQNALAGRERLRNRKCPRSAANPPKLSAISLSAAFLRHELA